MFKNKNILVAGGTGLIGIQLVKLLIQQKANVRIVSLDNKFWAHPKAEFIQTDLRYFENCIKVCKGIDYVFNLLCIKGSPEIARTKPASMLVPMLLFNTGLMEAARQEEVGGFLFTSSVAVYSPAEIFYEDDVWKTFPSENDWFPAWAKRVGELQVKAYQIENKGWENTTIVRPSNVYGPYDNFDSTFSMVIPALIKRAVDGENPLTVLGDGTAERDFIHSKDAARGILFAAKNAPGQTLNLGSGIGVSVKEIVEVILKNLDEKPGVAWDTSKPSGDKKRIMDISRIESLGFKPKISLENGIKEVMKWYKDNKNKKDKRYNIFKTH